jgi:hypothetical protein
MGVDSPGAIGDKRNAPNLENAQIPDFQQVLKKISPTSPGIMPGSGNQHRRLKMVSHDSGAEFA